MHIEKITPRVYRYDIVVDTNDVEYDLCDYARFIFDCEQGCLDIIATKNNMTKYYSYLWGYNIHEDFMSLMCRIKKDYLLDKIDDRYTFNFEESNKNIIKYIEENGFHKFGIHSEKQWLALKKKMNSLSDLSQGEFVSFIRRFIPDMTYIDIQIENDHTELAKVIVNLFENNLQPLLKKDFKEIII